MRSWWGKSSSKEEKKKSNKESFIYTINRKLKITSEEKSNNRSGRIPETLPQAQPLPLPGVPQTKIGRSDSGIGASVKPGLNGGGKQLHLLPLPRPGHVLNRLDQADTVGDIATASVSSDSSIDSDDLSDSRVPSPLTSDYENGNRTAVNSPPSVMRQDQSPIINRKNSRETPKHATLPVNNQTLSTPPKRAIFSSQVQNLQIPHRVAFFSAPDSSMSSPSRSPMRAFGTEQVINNGFWAGKTYSDIGLLGSGQCSSPGSGYNSGYNSGSELNRWRYVRTASLAKQ
ncbi:hypothetical protein OIU84_004043 [Salix udensis]|uniref:Uncharacterized protein n=1 Tax=Salix udensis TaxID=889485 RepID=A0AAD6K1M5_9ROSI|nr:hypothetical protein OIU84_004043 [Salix udensis]